jgi:glycosyltransferase involved in cell wall biosynthesis
MLKIGFICGLYCLGGEHNGFDFSNLWGDPRGLTGSELSFIQFARELSARTHRVFIFTASKSGYESRWADCEVRPLSELNSLDESWDCFCSWNEADVLRPVPPTALRLVNLQINDLSQYSPGYDDYVDVWTSPSDSHRDRIIAASHSYKGYTYTPKPEEWEVLYNGCDPSSYNNRIEKVSGRVIWASSPDRGLHWLLQAWPKIKRHVPHAHLRIFYKLQPWIDSMAGKQFPNPDWMELAQRATYVKEALGRLNNHDIEVIGSVSRNQMSIEMSEAQILAYPCDTVNWTEGFSVTLMEACAAGAVPITTDVDALGSIYGKDAVIIKSPVGENLDEFVDVVVKSLTDDQFRSEVTLRTRALANEFKWTKLTEDLEAILYKHLNRKRQNGN